MGNLKSSLQESFLLKLNSVSNDNASFINEVLSSKRYTTELTRFENEIISKFFGKGNDVCCAILFYSDNQMISKRLYNCYN